MAYFRATAYHPELDVCMIADSNGKFEKKWQFTKYLSAKGFLVLELDDGDSFTDGTLKKLETEQTQDIIRACGKGKPSIQGAVIEVNGRNYTSNERT